MVRILGLFMPMLKEVGEMLHQWDSDFVVDDARFRERFDVTATPLRSGAEATVAWARSRWGKPHSPGPPPGSPR
jgi:hypothetical protein